MTTELPSLTMAEIEALTLFLARRSELWTAEAVEMGIDPLGVPRKLALAYSRAVDQRQREEAR